MRWLSIVLMMQICFLIFTFLVKDSKDMSELWELLESIEIKYLDSSFGYEKEDAITMMS